MRRVLRQMAEAPEISIVITTFNRRELLARTLPRVLDQDLAAERRETIVVVDGSADGTELMLKAPAFARVRVISQPNRGLAAARNAGLFAARGALVLFLDDDLLCERDLVRRHLEAHRGGVPAVVGGEVLLADESASALVAQWREDSFRRYFNRVRSRADGGWPLAVRLANASVPRSALVDAGGFDERFRFAEEDTDLMLRLAALGLQFQYRPELAVRHVYRKSVTATVWNDAQWYGRSNVLLCRKYPGRRELSPLAGIQEGPALKAWMRRVAARARTAELAMRAMFAGAHAMRRVEPMRKAATRLLGARASLAMLRGASEACGSMRELRAEFGRRLPVLLYHHVGPPRPGMNPELSISPGTFERQVRWLARSGFTSVSCADWLAWRREARPFAENAFIMTFDDGYADLVSYALPVLRRYGFGATVFVVTGEIGGVNHWDRRAGWGELPLMNADEIRRWAASGIEFGSHSRSHRDLTLLSHDELRAEVEGSAKDLEALVATRPACFAYPFGRVNEAVSAQVGRVFDAAMTVDDGINTLATPAVAMRRLSVLPGDSMAHFALMMRLGCRPWDALRSEVALRTRLRRMTRIARSGVRRLYCNE
jgi:GT2 family glycosyltransferase/peptidoglycan/xylan/chitin deacetylase (PgdA/CDA1 family)